MFFAKLNMAIESSYTRYDLMKDLFYEHREASEFFMDTPGMVFIGHIYHDTIETRLKRAQNSGYQ